MNNESTSHLLNDVNTQSGYMSQHHVNDDCHLILEAHYLNGQLENPAKDKPAIVIYDENYTPKIELSCHDGRIVGLQKTLQND